MPRTPSSALRRSLVAEVGQTGRCQLLPRARAALRRDRAGRSLRRTPAAAAVQFGEMQQQITAVRAERVQRTDLSESLGDRSARPGALPEVQQRGVGLSGHDPCGLGRADAMDVGQRETDTEYTGYARCSRCHRCLRSTRHQFDTVGDRRPVHIQRQHRNPAPPRVRQQQPLRIHPRVVGEQPRVEGRGVVHLEPGRLVRRHGEGDRVRLAEAVRAEGLDDLPGTRDHFWLVAPLPAGSANQTRIRPCSSGSDSSRRTRSASSRPQPVMIRRISMICSWKTTTP